MTKAIKNFVNLMVVALFLFSQNSLAIQQSPYPTFNEGMNKLLNKHKMSHDIATAVLKHKPNMPRVMEEAKKILNQKSFLMPVYKIKGDTLKFEYFGKKYSMKHIQSSVYLINGKKIDIEKKGWEKEFAYQSTFNIFWHEADALAPLFFGIIVVVGILGFGCMAEGLGTQRSAPTFTAKFESASEINRSLNNMVKSVCRACGGACASTVGEFVNFHDLFSSYCKAAGDRGLDLYKHPRARESRRPGVVKLADGSINPEIYDFVKQRANQVTPQSFSESFMEKYQFQTCPVDSCAQTGASVSYSQLDGPIQDFISEVISNEEFNAQCVTEGLRETLEPKPAIPRGSSNRSSGSQQ